MKKILFVFMFLVLVSFPSVINASNIPVARINDTYYDTLEDAINDAGSNDVIVMISNLNLLETRKINKNITIDLNGFTITKDNTVFEVENGSLTLKGKGVIKETSPNYAPVVLKGSTNPSDTNYTSLYIDGDILLEGWAGVFISHNEKKAYGINVDLKNLKINSKTDSIGTTGSGIYVNGNIQDTTNYPVINIKNVTVNSEGNGIYLAGYAKTIIESSDIYGKENAIGIKAGILNIKSGNFSTDGVENIPTSGSTSSINPSGTTLQIESNIAYKGDIDITIEGGTFESENSHVIYEYIGNGTSTRVINFLITGGTFVSPKNVFLLSDSFIGSNSPFIKGGTYSSNPSSYIISGYKVEVIDTDYEVVPVFKEREENESSKYSSNVLGYLFLGIVLVSTTLYILSKKKLSK